MKTDFLTLPDRRLAYQRLVFPAATASLVFLGGFASDMTGTKASFLADACSAAEMNFLRFDYRGHGQSGGDFADGMIGGWLEDAEMAIDRLTTGPQILVGSSMGGWIALLLALRQPRSVKAVIGIAAAPDFTEDLIWEKLTPDQRALLVREGRIYENPDNAEHNPPLTLNLIEEARRHLLLRDNLAIACPVRLLQGMQDSEVPWQQALRIIDRITHDNAQVTLIKGGDHRLNRAQDLSLMWQAVREFVG